MANDGRDPLQKLKDLHDWLLNNSPSALMPVKAVAEPTWPTHNDKAAAEVEDFHNWVQEINRPNFVW